MSRACVIVLDAVGAGELPDAADWGDEGSDTLGNLSRAVGGLDLPNLEALGLGNVEPLEGCPPQPYAPAVAGRLLERSKGKDTTAGHWELMGVVTPTAFPTYPYGFPDEVIDPFMNRTGRGVLGNKPASGTEIIQELGEEHQRTGKWIVYTSADSVFQIAAHEETIPLEELYDGCRVARDLLTGKHAVGRVIARRAVRSWKRSAVTGTSSGAPLACQSGTSSESARGSSTAPDSVWAPSSEAFSRTQTEISRSRSRLSWRRRMAAARPAGPAPTITTSNCMLSRSMVPRLALNGQTWRRVAAFDPDAAA